MSGSITIDGQFDQGASDNKGLRLTVALADDSDGPAETVEDDDIDITYDTDPTRLPEVDRTLRNVLDDARGHAARHLRDARRHRGHTDARAHDLRHDRGRRQRRGHRAVIDIDGREFTLEEFGRILLTHEGWGMRLVFVDEDHVDEEPAIEMGEPQVGAGRPSRRRAVRFRAPCAFRLD